MTCVITAAKVTEFFKAEVLCPEGLPCRVECANNSACQEATIRCPKDQPCHVVCDSKSLVKDSDDACKGAKIECGNGPCTVECAKGDQQCRDTVVQCGPNDCSASCAGMFKPTIDCGCAQTCSCEKQCHAG